MRTVVFICFVTIGILLFCSASTFPNHKPRFSFLSLPSNPKHPIQKYHENAVKRSHLVPNAFSPLATSPYEATGGYTLNYPPIHFSKKMKNSAEPNKTKIILGYVPDVTGYRHRKGRSISGAMSYAIEQINKNPAILPNVELAFVYNDTKGLADHTNSILLDDLANHDVAAFIGPEGLNCQAAAELASQENKPIISFHCTDMVIPNMDKYPTFVRMDPSSSQLVSKAMEVLRQQGRSDFIIVSQKLMEWEKIARELERQVELGRRGDLTVSAHVQIMSSNDCWKDDEQPCCNQNWSWLRQHFPQYKNTYSLVTYCSLLQVLKQAHYVSNNYVFIGEPEYLVKFTEVMQKSGLFEEGNVSVLYLSPNNMEGDDLMSLILPMACGKINSCEELPNYEELIQGWKALTLITRADSFHGPPSFDDIVRKNNCLPPFNFPNANFFISSMPPIQMHISMYATHLFDGVVVYATALHYLIQQASTTRENISIENLAKDGRRITQAILDSRGYQSVSGKFVPLNHHGDSRGKFKIFRLKNTFFTKTCTFTQKNFTCRHFLMEEENMPSGTLMAGTRTSIPRSTVHPNRKPWRKQKSCHSQTKGDKPD